MVDCRYQCDGGSDCQPDNGPPEPIFPDAGVTKRAYGRPSEGELMNERDQTESVSRERSACVSPSRIPYQCPRDSEPGSLQRVPIPGLPLLQANTRIVGRALYESHKGVSNPFLRIPLEHPQEGSTSVDLKRTSVLIYAPCRFANSGLDSASGSTRTLMISRRSTSVTSATSTGLSSPTRSCRLRNISSGCRTTSEPSSWFNCRSGAWTTHPRRSSFDYLKSSLTVYLKGQMQRSRVGS